MREQGFLLGLLTDPRLAPYATGDIPAWLWSADATRVLWGNPAAAAIFNAPSSAALTGHTIDPKGSAALQIARLAGTLPHGAAPRLERLRGFGGRMGGASMCACSRILLADGTPAILVAATEAAGKRLSLSEQAQRLLTGSDEPLALFESNGALLHATPAARAKLGGAASLAVMGAAPLGATALAAGRAEGPHGNGRISIGRVGSAASTALLAAFLPATVEDEAPLVGDARQQEPEAQQPATPAPTEAAPIHPIETAVTESPVKISPNEIPSSETAARPLQPAAIMAPERRQPLRFVWQLDDDGRFTLNSEAFKTLLGPQTAAALGQPWSDMAAALGLDPEGQIARAFASRETWSGITVAFPVDGADTRLAVELSGLPVFDRDRNFRGYRGFGVCREVGRINQLTRAPRADAPTAARVEPPVFRGDRSASAPLPPPMNVVPFPASTPAESVPTLTPVERSAFSELATRLTARLRGPKDKPESPEEPAPPIAGKPAEKRTAQPREPRPQRTAAQALAADQRPILDRLPVGVLVYRLDKLIYANRAFLDWTGYDQLHALEEAGGLDALFVEPNDTEPGENNGAQSLTIATNQGDQVPVEARLFTSPWAGESALVLMLTGVGHNGGNDDRQKTFESALRHAKAEVGEIRDILDAAADGVVVLDQDAHVQSVNRGAEKLFGYQSSELTGLPFANLFAPESQRDVDESLGSASRPQNGSPRRGRDVIGRRREGGLVPLFMTLSRVDDGDKLCAIFRDMTFWKKTEGELLNAKRQAEKASSAKSDFIAKISHEIRTPLNAIIGFSEVMMQERFGPIGNERYRQYLKDIHTSGGHLVSLLNDLLDLSKIEAGKLELNFSSVDLNELTQQSVALMQPQANRERIIIRTSLGPTLPAVTADARSVRQILLNLLSNSIKFTGVGGQVIVSTAHSDDGEVVLRVRDTGVGMSEQDIAVAMEPFRQLATSARWGSGGTGLGLPLTKALAEANRASFKIRSAVNTGTLVEVAFPGGRVAAE